MTVKFEWRKTRSQGANGGLPSLVLFRNDEYAAEFITQDKVNNKIEYSATNVSGYNISGNVAYFGTNSLLFDNVEKLNDFLKSKNMLLINDEQKKYVETIDSYSVHLHNFSDFTLDITFGKLEKIKKESASSNEFVKKVNRFVNVHNDIKIVEPSKTELAEYYNKV